MARSTRLPMELLGRFEASRPEHVFMSIESKEKSASRTFVIHQISNIEQPLDVSYN